MMQEFQLMLALGVLKHIEIIGVAFIADLLFGDPRWLPHPICLIGNTISFLEKKIRKNIKNELLGGLILVMLLLILSYSIPFGILKLASIINGYLEIFLETFFCYQIFAVKSLKSESMKVYGPLIKGDLQEARKYLSYIVGRDTDYLEEKGITKATVETIAENTTDGIIAPLLFMVIGGAPVGFLYKAINTMDSMIGYKNEKYIRFGKCAARLDDVANFIPARFSALVMIGASALLGFDFKKAFKIYVRDRHNHKSPNSAQTEAVCAGALRVELAGDAYYFGKLVKKQTIGDSIVEIKPEHIALANRLMVMTAILSVVVVYIGEEILLWLI